MNPDIFRVYGTPTKRQLRALTKVFKECTFDWTLLKRGLEANPGIGGNVHITFRFTDTSPHGGYYKDDTKFIMIDPKTVGTVKDFGRMRIAVKSITHELGHAVDANCLDDADRAEILKLFKCEEAPCTHPWRPERYYMRPNESFADAFLVAFSKSKPGVRRGHTFDDYAIRRIRELLA